MMYFNNAIHIDLKQFSEIAVPSKVTDKKTTVEKGKGRKIFYK